MNVTSFRLGVGNWGNPPQIQKARKISAALAVNCRCFLNLPMTLYCVSEWLDGSIEPNASLTHKNAPRWLKSKSLIASKRASMHFNDQGMIADCHRDAVDVVQDLDWCGADRNIVNHHLRVGAAQLDCNIICTSDLFAPHH